METISNELPSSIEFDELTESITEASLTDLLSTESENANNNDNIFTSENTTSSVGINTNTPEWDNTVNEIEGFENDPDCPFIGCNIKPLQYNENDKKIEKLGEKIRLTYSWNFEINYDR